jgi:hypothetical protein
LSGVSEIPYTLQSALQNPQKQGNRAPGKYKPILLTIIGEFQINTECRTDYGKAINCHDLSPLLGIAAINKHLGR